MKFNRILLACSLVFILCSLAFAAEYWVIREGGKMVIVESKPTDAARIVKGPFATRAKAEAIITQPALGEPGTEAENAAVNMEEQTVKTGRASKLEGLSLVDNRDQRVGKVYDLIVDKEGRISYVILEHGGFLGIGDKFVLMPWSAFAPTGKFNFDKSGYLKLDFSKAQLEKAPNFDAGHWPDFAKDEQLRSKVNSFFRHNAMESGSKKRK